MSNSIELNRRELLNGILVLVGSTITGGVSLEAMAAVAGSGKRNLDAASFETLSAVADTIIPGTDSRGALAADVPGNFDALLQSWAAPGTQKIIVEGLQRIETAAASATGQSFVSLSADARKAFLIEHEQAALQPAPPPPDAPKKQSIMARPYVADSGYQRIKELVVALYYVSEIGMTQEQVYEHVPGKWVPSLKITPGMRPFSSPGLM